MPENFFKKLPQNVCIIFALMIQYEKLSTKGASEMRTSTVNSKLKLKYYEAVAVLFPFPICLFNIAC